MCFFCICSQCIPCALRVPYCLLLQFEKMQWQKSIEPSMNLKIHMKKHIDKYLNVYPVISEKENFHILFPGTKNYNLHNKKRTPNFFCYTHTYIALTSTHTLSHNTQRCPCYALWLLKCVCVCVQCVCLYFYKPSFFLKTSNIKKCCQT